MYSKNGRQNHISKIFFLYTFPKQWNPTSVRQNETLKKNLTQCYNLYTTETKTQIYEYGKMEYL